MDRLPDIYMNIQEHLLLLNEIRLLWLNNKPKLAESLFIRDGTAIL